MFNVHKSRKAFLAAATILQTLYISPFTIFFLSTLDYDLFLIF